MSEYIEMWKRGLDFSGKTTIREYWMAVLINFIIVTIFSFLGEKFITILGVYVIAAWLPMLALLIRRLHDINKSGWWVFITFVPLAGFIVLLVFLCTNSVEDNNIYNV